MPVEIKELQIKVTVAPADDALMLFGAADAAGKGTHAGGIDVVWGDGSVRATVDAHDDLAWQGGASQDDHDRTAADQSFAAPDDRPVPTEQMSLTYFKINLDAAGALDLF